jgi:TPR repeat protein
VAERRAAVALPRGRSAGVLLAAAVLLLSLVAGEVPTAAAAGELPSLPPASVGERRVALVIGNGAYRTATPLPNPPNDAADVAAALERLGFAVLKGVDLDRLAMEDLAAAFARAAADADIALAYFAGHGLQVRDVNYLVPVDGRLRDEVDLRRLPRLDDLIEDAGRARRLGLVVVDACRDNPLAAALRRSLGPARALEAGGGLAPPAIPRSQTLVAYATAARDVAADGAGRNSPFTAAFLEHLGQPEDVRLVFGRVRDAVVAATDGEQRPEIWGSLGGEPVSLAPAEPPAERTDASLTEAERRAVQRSLRALGHYRGVDDGRFSPAVRAGLREFQLSQGAPATGFLTVAQTVALHEIARHRRPPEPLPPFDLIDLLRRSEAGETAMQRLRGMVHDDAFAAGGLPKDEGEAARWYERAAAAGDALAAERLGRLLMEGDELDEDAAGAARWLGLAAAAGRLDALLGLAELHEQGRGVPRDRDEAVRLYSQAAADPTGGAAVAKLRALGAWRPEAVAATARPPAAAGP